MNKNDTEPADHAEPNTKYVTVKMPIPRDPSAYEAHTHYLQRKKYRSDPSIKTWIVEEVISEGHCRCMVSPHTVAVDGDDTQDVARFAFEKEVWSEGVHEWRVIVAINADAFVKPSKNHMVLTAYCPCHDEGGDGQCG